MAGNHHLQRNRQCLVGDMCVCETMYALRSQVVTTSVHRGNTVNVHVACDLVTMHRKHAGHIVA
jgi:hypothetical protein